MVVDYTGARDVLHSRLQAIFDPERFAELYPGTAQAPRVYLGFPVTEPPFYAAVDEIIDSADATGGASMGHQTVTFQLHVWLCAQHSSLKEASDALLAYTDAVFGAVIADPQLNRTVDNSFAAIETAGTAADPSKRYVAAASVSVTCTVYAACPAGLMAAVRADNERISEEEDASESG